MKHLEILAYAMNVALWRDGDREPHFLITTEEAKKSQDACGFGEVFKLSLVEDVTVGTVLTALDGLIARHYGKAYTPSQFVGARKELVELNWSSDQQKVRELVCPDR